MHNKGEGIELAAAAQDDLRHRINELGNTVHENIDPTRNTTDTEIIEPILHFVSITAIPSRFSALDDCPCISERRTFRSSQCKKSCLSERDHCVLTQEEQN